MKKSMILALGLGMVLFAQEERQFDVDGNLIRDQHYFYNYIPDPSGRGVQRVTLDQNRREVARDAVSSNKTEQPQTTLSKNKAREIGEYGCRLDAGKPVWSYGLLGSALGASGIHMLDLNGQPALLLGGSSSSFGDNDFWYFLTHENGGYHQQHVSEFYGDYNEGVNRLQVADLDGDGHKEVLVGHVNRDILVFQPGCSVPEVVIPTVDDSAYYFDELRHIEIGDVDADGALDIVVGGRDEIVVLQAQAPYAEKYKIEGLDIRWMDVGQIDSDPELEIVIAEYDRGLVLAFDGAIKWDYPLGFGRILDVANVDGDPYEEIVTSEDGITVFDGDTKTLKWNRSVQSYRLQNLYVADINQDGMNEVLYGDDQWGSIYALTGQTGTELWSIPNPEHGVADILVEDVDQDGEKELIWAAGWTSSGPDHLYIADLNTLTVEWVSEYFEGPLTTITHGDVNGDDHDEVVMISQGDSSRSPSIIHVFDGATRTLIWRRELGFNTWDGTRDCFIEDIDQDGSPELVLASSEYYRGLFLSYDALTGDFEAQFDAPVGDYGYGEAVNKILPVDVNDDGVPEFVTHNEQKLALLSSDFEVTWESPNLDFVLRDIAVADIDDDGHQELLACGYNSDVMIFDSVTHQLQEYLDVNQARSIHVADDAVFVGTTQGKVHRFQGTPLVETGVQTFFNGERITGLSWVEMGEVSLLLVTTSGDMGLFDYESGEQQWRSTYRASGLAGYNEIVVTDTDGDGMPQFFVGSEHLFMEYEVTCGRFLLDAHIPQWGHEMTILDLLQVGFCPE